MENSLRYNRAHVHCSLKERQLRYEPSDTETDWQESPWHDLEQETDQNVEADTEVKPNALSGPSMRKVSPVRHIHRPSYKSAYELPTLLTALKSSPVRRCRSKSPYKLFGDDFTGISPKTSSRLPRSTSVAHERRRHISPLEMRENKSGLEGFHDQLRISNRIQNLKIPSKFIDLEDKQCKLHTLETPSVAEKSPRKYSPVSTPEKKAGEKEPISAVSTERRGQQSHVQLSQGDKAQTKATTVEVNEMIADAKLSKVTISDLLMMGSIDSIPPGNIFFSNDTAADDVVMKNHGFEGSFLPKMEVLSGSKTSAEQRTRGIPGFGQNGQEAAATNIPSQRNYWIRSKSSNISTDKSKITDGNGMTSESFQKFTANRQRSQMDRLFSCVRTSFCTKSRSKSPEIKEFDEASFIEKALIVEELPQFWADKHHPVSLSEFICHKRQARHLRQLILHKNFLNIVLRGPSGSGKKALCMALMNEIFGASVWDITNDVKYLNVQETQKTQMAVPVASSMHHVELDLRSVGKNSRYALVALVKEMTSSQPIPDFSTESLKANYKVILLYKAEKLEANLQHLMRWIMECHAERCKILICCEDDLDLLPSIKSHCETIMVDSPGIDEIIEVLLEIAKKENVNLPASFAAKIAAKSKQNLRNAIMALEACKANSYPFVEEQPIPLGWEHALVELAEEILADPSHKILFYTRANLQKLLSDFVHPKLILQKLVEQFLKSIDGSLRRELYYWHAYYDKRLPTGTGALLKLEEFVAKFIGIYNKSFIYQDAFK